MKKLKKMVQDFLPWNEQERKDKERILKAMEEKEILTRNNEQVHFTVSAWIVSPDRK